MKGNVGRHQLEYSSHSERRAPEPLYWVGLICGILPLATAFIALVGYWVFENAFFVELGLADLKFGGIAVAIGIVSSIVFRCYAKCDTVASEQALRKAKVAIILLLINFPAAIFCTFAGIRLVMIPMMHYEIHNHSSSALDSGTLTQGNAVMQFGVIPQNEHIDMSHRLSPGQLDLSVLRAGSKQKKVVREYMDGDDFRPGRSPRLIIRVYDNDITLGGK